MSVENYIRKLSLLSVNQQHGRSSPHKICMLLALFDLARSGALPVNRITYSPALLERYSHYFNAVRALGDHPNPYFPFFHLRGKLRKGEQSFWHLKPLPGREAILQSMRTARSASDITNNISYAELDEGLFQLLQDSAAVDCLSGAMAAYWFDRGLSDLHKVMEQGRQISAYEHKLRDLSIGHVSESSPPEYVRSPAFRRIVTESTIIVVLRQD